MAKRWTHAQHVAHYNNYYASNAPARNARRVGPWTLLQTLPAAWWDFSNVASLFQDTAGATPVATTGQQIARVNDLSGNGRNLTQATAANRPVYTAAAQNGLSVSTHDGSNDYFSFSDLGIQELFFVGAGVQPSYATLLAHTTGFPLSGNTTASGLLLHPTSSAAAVRNGTSAHDGTVMAPVALTRPGAGYTQYHIGATDPQTFNTLSSDRLLGGRFWTGKVAEVVAYSTPLDAFERRRIEGYLAWKWGIVSSLPADHPYKSSGVV